MKFKKKLALVMAAVATISSIGATTALASSTDMPWVLSNSSSYIWGPREKEDTTSAWGLVFEGCNAQPGEYISMQLKRDSSGSDLVGTYRVLPPVTWAGSGSRYIPSNAYENGYTTVYMRIQKLPSNTKYVGGNWSPDSI